MAVRCNLKLKTHNSATYIHITIVSTRYTMETKLTDLRVLISTAADS